MEHTSLFRSSRRCCEVETMFIENSVRPARHVSLLCALPVGRIIDLATVRINDKRYAHAVWERLVDTFEKGRHNIRMRAIDADSDELALVGIPL